MAEPTGLDDLPQATVVRPKRARISVIWIIPILAAIVAIGIAVQRILSEGPTITIIFSAAEGIEAGKTAHQVQGREHRPGHEGRAELRLHQGARHREDRQACRRADGRRCEVLGRAAEHQPERSLRAQHVALGQLHRFRARQVDGTVRTASSGSTWHRSLPGSRAGCSCSPRAISGRSKSARRSTIAACRSVRSPPTTLPPTASRFR